MDNHQNKQHNNHHHQHQQQKQSIPSSSTPPAAGNNGKMLHGVWKQMLADLGPLCKALIELERLGIVAGSGPSSSSGAEQHSTLLADVNGHAEGTTHPESVFLLSKLREIVASVDCQLLKFKPVDPAQMWANTFCKPICERQDLFEMSIFGFRSAGHQIPLHDHPKMFGLIRPLHGRIRVSSYSWLEPEEEAKLLLAHDGDASEDSNKQAKDDGQMVVRPARYEGQFVLSTPPVEGCPAPEVAILDPNGANVHLIEALEDGSAFFDLLVPGYHSQNRVCTYYTVVSSGKEPSIREIVWLEGSEDTPEEFTMQRVVSRLSSD